MKLAGIPCVGCDTYSSAVSMHKCAAKIIAETVGVRTTPFVRLRKCDRDTAPLLVKDLKLPLFVKPVNGGSSVGITKVKSLDMLEEALDVAFETDDLVIIEEGVVGKEIEVAVLGKDEVLASVCGEIVAGAEFYDYENKYKDDTAEYYIPARLDEKTAETVRKNAVAVYKSLDCKGFSRVDFFVTADGDVLFNEINTIPGFTAISMYPKLMGECGIPYSELITRLIMAEAE
jgi:D-alanine-D-alanine ligase